MSYRYTHRNDPTPDATVSGPLAGQRVVIQPNVSVRGWLCTAGSHALNGYRALEDATFVACLLRSGAVLSGSSRMAELGFGLAGDTTAGLLADGDADLAVISDTLGEARLAAAGAGLFGFKPSHGRVSRHGLIGLAPSLECPGIVARQPGSILEMLAAMAGPDPDDPSMPDDCMHPFDRQPSDPAPLRTAGVIGQAVTTLAPAARRIFEDCLARLTAADVVVREIDLPEYGLCRDTHQAIASVEASSSAGKFDGVRYGHRVPTAKLWNEMYLETRKTAFGPLLKAFLFQGAYFQFDNFAAFDQACRLRRRLVQAVTRHLEQVDLLVMPTRHPACDIGGAATIAGTYDAFAFTLPANLTGQPALHLPDASPAPDGYPGMQLIGRRLDDVRLLALGTRLAALAQEGQSDEI